MRVSKLKVTVEVRQRRKALVWTYIRLMVLPARLGLINTEEAMRRAGQVLADSIYYRVGNSDWRPVGLECAVGGGAPGDP